MLKKLVLGAIGLIVIIVVINSLSGGGGSKTVPTPVAQAATSGPTKAPIPTSQAPGASPTEATQAKPATSATGGITFGRPIVHSIAGMSTVEVLATNTTDMVKSFTVKATFKSGDNIVATAAGAVNDMLPGQKRAVNLLATDKIPDKYDSVRVEIDTMVSEQKTTTSAEAAKLIKFGPPSVKSTAGMGTVDVEVTNGDTVAHSFTVQAAFLQGGELVGDAVGAINDLGPGQTKTATLLATGDIPKHDQVLLAVDTLAK